MFGAIDWEAVRERLAAAQAALDRSEENEEARDALFSRRAEALAAPPPAAAPADAVEALVFALGGEHYAFPTHQVREVRPLDRLTPLPSAPPFVAGLMNVRGRVVPVVDLRPLLGTAGAPGGLGGSGRAAVLLVRPLGDVALLATDWPAIRSLRKGELGPLPAGAPAGLDPVYVHGVTPDLVVLLDGVRLLASPRLRVEEDV